MLEIDHEQVGRFAALLRGMPSVKPFDFCTKGEGVLFPARNDPGAVGAFFFNAAHQFGFWFLDGRRYSHPMIAPAGGIYRKGSDFLFYCTQRALLSDPDFFNPEKLAALRDSECEALFHDDNRNNPLPMWPEHRMMIREYAEWMINNRTSPDVLLAKAVRTTKPLAYLLDTMKQIPGYREDPLQKKAMLLAVILENRPEHFLPVTDTASAVPIVDYHLQRSALRTGLLKITDPRLHQKLASRSIVEKEVEGIIRKATYRAIGEVTAQSGLSMAAVDYFFFQNRERCPEMSTPDCAACPVRSICKKETGLFQPVFRTTYY